MLSYHLRLGLNSGLFKYVYGKMFELKFVDINEMNILCNVEGNAL